MATGNNSHSHELKYVVRHLNVRGRNKIFTKTSPKLNESNFLHYVFNSVIFEATTVYPTSETCMKWNNICMNEETIFKLI